MRTKNEPWPSPQETKMSIETIFGWFLLLSITLSIFLFFGLYLQLISILIMFKGLAPVPKQESASLRNLRRKSRKKKLMSIQRSDKNELKCWTIIRTIKIVDSKMSEKEQIDRWCFNVPNIDCRKKHPKQCQNSFQKKCQKPRQKKSVKMSRKN